MTPSTRSCGRKSAERILEAAESIGLLGTAGNGRGRILAVLCNSYAQTDDVIRLLQSEPALHMQVLRVANSAFYGRPRTISSLQDALLLLGLDAVRMIAATACLLKAPSNRSPATLIDHHELQRHSIGTALAAEYLASRACPALRRDAYAAGLLHNLGVSVQCRLEPESVLNMIRARQFGDYRPMPALETENVSVSHETCVGILSEAWHLPELLSTAMSQHHTSGSCQNEAATLGSIIYLANLVALQSGLTFSLEPRPLDMEASLLQRLGIADGDLREVVRNLPTRVGQLMSATAP